MRPVLRAARAMSPRVAPEGGNLAVNSLRPDVRDDRSRRRRRPRPRPGRDPIRGRVRDAAGAPGDGRVPGGRRRCCSTSAPAHVELLQPLGPETVVGRFIAKRGEGLHHVAYRVGDIDATLATLKEAGVELIDTEARVGIRGSRVAFLHPKAAGGVADRARRAGPGRLARREGGSDGRGHEAGRGRLRRRPGDDLRGSSQARAALREASLHRAGSEPRWYDLETEDGSISLDLAQVVFVRIAGAPHTIGFSDT